MSERITHCASRITALLGVVLLGCGGGAPARPADADRSQELYLQGKFDEAEAALRSAVRRDPADGLARRLLGRVLLMRNQARDAVEQLNEAVRLATDKRGRISDPGAVQDLAWAHYRLDDYARVSQAFTLLNESVLAAKYGEMTRVRPPYTAAWRSESSVSGFQSRDPLPVIQMRVNGVGGLFIVDTSAGELVLDRDFAKTLRARVVGTATRTISGSLEEGFVDSVDLPGLELRNVPVVLHRLKELGGRKIHGAIGSAFLAHFNTTLDLRRERFVLRRLGSETPQGGQEVPLYLASDRYFLVPGEIDGKPTLLFLNLGLPGAAFTGSPAWLEQGAAREAKVGLLKLAGSSAAFPGGLELAFGYLIGGQVGMDAFRGRSVTLNVDRMRLVIE